MLSEAVGLGMCGRGGRGHWADMRVRSGRCCGDHDVEHAPAFEFTESAVNMRTLREEHVRAGKSEEYCRSEEY